MSEIENLDNFLKIAYKYFQDGKPIEEILFLYQDSLDKKTRKQFGIYYTPLYICKFIVKNCIRLFVEDKEIDEIQNIKILDPSCGCGLFLLVAFDYINKYLELYFGRPLILEERIQIVENNLYGVDIDPDAVKITKILLTMKVYEDNRDQFQY